jgi:hypothetical protein
MIPKSKEKSNTNGPDGQLVVEVEADKKIKRLGTPPSLRSVPLFYKKRLTNWKNDTIIPNIQKKKEWRRENLMNESPVVYTLKQEIEASMEDLPLDALKEVVDFLDYLRVKYKKSNSSGTPYRPVALDKLWNGQINENKNIDDICQEMWKNFGKREL